MTNSPTEKHSAPTNKKKAGRIILIILLVLLLLIASLGGVYFALYSRGKNELEETRESVILPDIETIEYNGESYSYDTDVFSVLCLGVDKKDIQADKGYGLNGQADSIFVATVNTRTGVIHIIPLSRESMAQVDVYATDGTFIGTEVEQLCLAYAYGSDGNTCAKNVEKSVRRLLGGVSIDAYMAIDMAGVRVMTDKIGGINLTPIETFYNDEQCVSFVKGQPMVMDGNAAEGYIRYRDDDVEANSRRMQRQKDFLNAFVQKVSTQLKSNFTLLSSYYDTAKPYLVSDLSLSKITYLATRYLSGEGNQGLNYLSIAGESRLGKEYAEFYPDTASIQQAVVEAFYQKTTE